MTIAPTCLVLALLAVVTSPVWADERPTVTATWRGHAEVAFDADNSKCDEMDIPDSPPRAFRDYTGTVHLFATLYDARAMVGPTLDSVRRDCHVVYRSPGDPDPAHFRDRNWLDSFYTEDGRDVVALVHSEYQGWTHPGMCATPHIQTPHEQFNCWWTTITMAVSHDGGYNFEASEPPGSLVASVPYAFDRANTAGAAGYHEPTNIIKIGSYFYAMLNNWPFKAQKYGACLIRTTDPFSATSWRAWDGADFTIRFMNPYIERGAPEQHVCVPVSDVAVPNPDSLSIEQGGRRCIAVQFTPDRRFGSPGLYLSASSDLIHWSKPSLVASTEAMEADEMQGKWKYGYFALLDPASSDRNFATVSKKPYLYYVRINLVRGNLSRTLMRRPILLKTSP